MRQRIGWAQLVHDMQIDASVVVSNRPLSSNYLSIAIGTH